jgi:outer membrane protein assembly factor BamA
VTVRPLFSLRALRHLGGFDGRPDRVSRGALPPNGPLLSGFLCLSLMLPSGSARAEPPDAAPGPSAVTTQAPPELAQTAVHDSQAREPLRYFLDGVEVRGNVKTRSATILRHVPFIAGDVLDVDDPRLLLTRYRLIGTGFFRDVELSLRRGESRGHVVLVIQVVERNTIIVNELSMGIGSDADTDGQTRPLTAYAGVSVAETHLGGTGITLGSSLALARDQVGLRVFVLDPVLPHSSWMTRAELLYNNAQDFFGNRVVLWDDPNQTEGVPRHAVITYNRFGGSVGVGRDLSMTAQLWLDYRLESISNVRLPRAAAHDVGGELRPIDFDILHGQSFLSTIRTQFEHDTRDRPFLTTSGTLINVGAELSLAPLGSDYAYQRLEVAASRYFHLPWQHVLSVDAFAGAIGGDAPFFEQYYVGDLTDFRPHRLLGLNFDRRPAPNFLGTSIQEVRYADYAAKLSSEYRVPLFRGSRSVYGIDLFTSFGIYGLANDEVLLRPPRKYRGLERIPVDLTANLGVKMDTSAGGFVFALSSVIGFVPRGGDSE